MAENTQTPRNFLGSKRPRKTKTPRKGRPGKLFEKAINPGTTSRLTRRKCLFSWFRMRTHKWFVRLTGRLSRGQPDPQQSKKFMLMCLFLFLFKSVRTPRGSCNHKLLKGFSKGSLEDVLLKRVLRRCLLRISVGIEVLRRGFLEGEGCHRRRLEGRSTPFRRARPPLRAPIRGDTAAHVRGFLVPDWRYYFVRRPL